MPLRALLFVLALLLPSLAAAEPATVRVSVHINDIQQVNLRSHSFYVDAYVGFRWRDPELEPVKTMTWLNPYELWAHVTRPMTGGPRTLPDGDSFEWVRHRGQFNVTLPLQRYPFDRQLLIAEFSDRALPIERMVYVPEKISIAQELSLPGYITGAPRLTVSASQGLGAVEDLIGDQDLDFTRLRIEIPIERPRLTYVVKLLLPLFLATGCAALLFLVPARFVEARMGLGITSLLILVALQLTLNADLPEVDYLMALDKLYLASYFFDFAALGLVAWTSARHLDDLDGPTMRRLDRRILASLGVAYAVLVTLALTTNAA